MHDGSAIEFASTEIHEPTMRELVHRYAIHAVCRCGRARSIEAERICVPPSTPISEVGSYLTCRVCKTRGLVTRIAPRTTWSRQ